MPTLRKLWTRIQLQLLWLLGKACAALSKSAAGSTDQTIQSALPSSAIPAGTICYIPMEIKQGNFRWQPFIVEFNTADGTQRMMLYAFDHYHAGILVEDLRQSEVTVRKLVVKT